MQPIDMKYLTRVKRIRSSREVGETELEIEVEVEPIPEII